MKAKKVNVSKPAKVEQLLDNGMIKPTQENPFPNGKKIVKRPALNFDLVAKTALGKRLRKLVGINEVMVDMEVDTSEPD